MSIEKAQLMPLFTQSVSAIYREMAPTPRGFAGMFPSNTNDTRYVSIEVERDNELIAVDVVRGTGGNYNQFSKSTQKIWEPPAFEEVLFLTEFQTYSKTFGSSSQTISQSDFDRFMNEFDSKLGKLVAKIQRKEELMCSQIMDGGIITLKNSDNIDFKRKAASQINVSTRPGGSGQYWDNAAATPLEDIAAGCKFIRDIGKSTGIRFKAILGDACVEKFRNNATVQARLNERRADTNRVAFAEEELGMTYLGTIEAEQYIIDFFAYSWSYIDPEGGQRRQYWPVNKTVILPSETNFIMEYGGITELREYRDNGQFTQTLPTVASQYSLQQYVDLRNRVHEASVCSAPLPVPVAIDTIATLQCLA